MVEEEGVAPLVSLREEVGAFLGSRVLTHAFGTVAGEGEHPWHHFGSWVAGVEELQGKSTAVRLRYRDGEGWGNLRDVC